MNELFDQAFSAAGSNLQAHFAGREKTGTTNTDNRRSAAAAGVVENGVGPFWKSLPLAKRWSQAKPAYRAGAPLLFGLASPRLAAADTASEKSM